MNGSQTPTGRPRLSTAWPAVSRGLLLLAVGALLAACAYVFLNPAVIRSALDFVTAHSVSIGLAIACYVASHMVRALRLAVLAGDHTTSIRRLVEVHFYTAAVSIIAPLKLGEIYRVLELSNVVQSLPRAVLTVWLERTFDVFAILLLMTFAALTTPDIIPIITPLLVLSLAFLVATYVALVVFPESLPGLALFVLRRYRSRGAVGALQAIESYRGLVKVFSRIAHGKQATTAVLTGAIWSLEILTLWLIVPVAGGKVSEAVSGLLVILSETSSGASYLLATLSERGDTYLRSAFGLDPGSISAYGLVTRLPLLFLGAAVGVSYALWRLFPARSGVAGARRADTKSA